MWNDSAPLKLLVYSEAPHFKSKSTSFELEPNQQLPDRPGGAGANEASMAPVVAAGGFLRIIVHVRGKTTQLCPRLFLHGNMFHFISRAKSCDTRHQSQDSCQQLKWKTEKWNCYTQQRLPLSFNLSEQYNSFSGDGRLCFLFEPG